MSVHRNLYVQNDLSAGKLNGVALPQDTGVENTVLVNNGSGEFSWGALPTQDLNVTDNVQFNNLTLAGNLTVSGTTTTINTAQLAVKDNIIQLNKEETGAGVTSGTSGIEVVRGTEANARLAFDEASDKWTVGLVGGTANQLVESADVSHTQGAVPAYDVNGHLSEAEGLTPDTVSSLQNIGSTVISADKWTALSNLQSLESSSTPSLKSLTISEPVKHELNEYTSDQTISKSVSIFDTLAPTTGDLVVGTGGTVVLAGTYERYEDRYLSSTVDAGEIVSPGSGYVYYINKAANKSFVWAAHKSTWVYCDSTHTNGGLHSIVTNAVDVVAAGNSLKGVVPITDTTTEFGGSYSYTSGSTTVTATLPYGASHVGDTFVIVLRKKFDNLIVQGDSMASLDGEAFPLVLDSKYRVVKVMCVDDNNWITV